MPIIDKLNKKILDNTLRKVLALAFKFDSLVNN